MYYCGNIFLQPLEKQSWVRGFTSTRPMRHMRFPSFRLVACMVSHALLRSTLYIPNRQMSLQLLFITAPNVGSLGASRFSEDSSQKLLRFGKLLRAQLSPSQRALFQRMVQLPFRMSAIRSPALRRACVVLNFASTLSYYLSTVLPPVKLL